MRVAQLVEQWTFNPMALGSNPNTHIPKLKNKEEMVEWLKTADCKSARKISYIGSNPIFFIF